MSFWTSLRDAIESVAVVAGNYFLPGSSMITSQLVSNGAQNNLNSTLGQLAQIGSGVYGGAQGNLGNYGKLYDTGANALGFGAPPGLDESVLGAAGGVPGALDESVLGAAVPQRSNGLTNPFTWFSSGNSSFPNSLGTAAGQAGATPFSGLGTPGNLFSIASGVNGLQRSRQLQKIAGNAAAAADPWGASGGRAQASGQLQQLLADPNYVTQLPGYQAGLQAVQRSLASQGYLASGNMMAALQKYGGDFYNNAVNQLGGLAGAGVNPGTGAQLGLQGNIAANTLAGQGLYDIGAGLGYQRKLNGVQ